MCKILAINPLQSLPLARYCPLNKDGAFNQGASLTELKKKRNAAGSYPGRGVMLCQPLPREMRDQAEHPTVAR